MQLTKLDRWLKECFIYETHIFTLRLPEGKLPRAVTVKKLEQGKSGDYKFKLIIKSKRKVDPVIVQLKADHLMYSTHVVEGRHWYNSMLSPDGKSFTYRWIFRCLGLITIGYIAWGVYLLWQNQGLMDLLNDALKDFK